MGLKAKIEAILFLNANPLSAPELATQANADLDDVRAALSQLIQDYESRSDCGLMIDTTDGYSLQVREDYETLSQGILEIALKTGCLRTLSVIALKEPIFQSELVNMRGGGAYEHIKELVEMGLVKKQNEGHKHVLRTTKMFHDYFRMTENGIELQTVLKKHSDRVRFTRGAEEEAGVEQQAGDQASEQSAESLSGTVIESEMPASGSQSETEADEMQEIAVEAEIQIAKSKSEAVTFATGDEHNEFQLANKEDQNTNAAWGETATEDFDSKSRSDLTEIANQLSEELGTTQHAV